MKLLTKPQERRLLRNGGESVRAAIAGVDYDPKPVVKLFTPTGRATWLLSEIDPECPDRAFGLCDMGMGYPELGYVSLSELRSIRLTVRVNGRKFTHPRAPGVERDRHWKAQGTLSQYADAARANQGITDNLEVAV